MSESANNEQISTRDEKPQQANREKTDESTDHTQHAQVSEEPSGYRGENPSTAGLGGTGIRSVTPENARGHLNPSAPGDTGTTPGTTPQE